VSPAESDTPDSPRVTVCTTGKGPKGKGSELEKAIRITAERGKKTKVVMSLGPSGDPFSCLPDLEPGDMLRVTAEIEVTTDSSEPYFAKPYEFDPMVRASLLLAGSGTAREPDRKRALTLGSAAEQRCTHESHHGVIVFTDATLRIPQKGLPWRGESFVNLLLDAHHPKAAGEQMLLIGEHEHVGGRIEVKGGKGRLNAIRFRPGAEPAAQTLRRSDLRAKEIPVDKEERTVVYSLPLDDLARGEQLTVEAAMTTSHPGYPSRISTRLILADKESQDDTGGQAKKLTDFGGEIGEHNGFNGKDGRFRTRRVGVFRVRRPAKRAYVNLVADSGDPLGQGKRGDKLGLIEDGFLRVTRYDPTLRG
jgi:hypothetical protein